MRKDLIQKIKAAQEMLDHHEQMRKAYFFTPPSIADMRRRYERKHTISESFEYDGHTYEYLSHCHCSCRNVYFKDNFLFDDKKTTCTKIKNVLKKMEAELTLLGA